MTTRYFRRFCATLTMLPILAGCTVLDSAIDGRAKTVNGAAGDYASVAILTNIVRAKNYEPLNFVSLTGYTGHDTFNSALPGFVLPPANPVSFAFGSSTASTVFSNDFNVSVLDDPGSYAALLEPINPALMGLFIKAGYPRELIYLLFFDYLRIKGPDGIDVYNNLPERIDRDIALEDKPFDCLADRHNALSFYRTICKIESLVTQGLTIDIDSDFQPSSDAIPSYELCFDPALRVPVFDPKRGVYQRLSGTKPASPQCDTPNRRRVLGWHVAENSSPSSTSKVVRNVGDAKIVTDDSPHELRPNYTVLDSDGEIVEIHTRSILGAYQYLGQILHNQFHNVHLRYSDTQDGEFLQTTSVAGDDCFASIVDKGDSYCVPNRAANTKRIFSLLRQLTGLLTKPNNQPATSTVRNTPN